MSQPAFTDSPGSLPESAQLRWRGLLQTANLRVASAAIIQAPTFDDCAAIIERAREDLEALEHTVEAYREEYGSDLSTELRGAVASLPIPETWLEVVVAQLVLCVASQMEARTSVTSHARKMEHVAAARFALRDLWASSPSTLECVPELVSRWLGVACSALDERAKPAYLEALRRELEPAPLTAAL